MTTKLSKQQLMMSLVTATINSADFTELKGWNEYIEAARELSNIEIEDHPMNVPPYEGCSEALSQVTHWMKTLINKHKKENSNGLL